MIRSVRSTRDHLGRVTAIAASVLLVVLGPAGAPAFAATPTNSEQVGPEAWLPPPVDDAALPGPPPPGGQPDGVFTPSNNGGGCITSGVGSQVKLLDRPAAQGMLNIDQAQQFSTGKNVTVAVIDTGVNPHPFLKTNNRLKDGGDYILNDHTALSDCDGHGTIVAGIVAADTRGQGLAFSGVAPDANILAIKHTSTHFTAPDGNGGNRTAGDLLTLAEAIRYASDQPDVKVITMSVDDCVAAADAQATLASDQARKLQAAIHYAVAVKDKVVIAAAGNLPSSDKNTDQNGQQQTSGCQSAGQNNNPNPNAVNQVQIPPVYSDDVLSVASVSPTTGGPSSFSVWGPWVTIAAPGEGITSIDPGPHATGLSNQTVENNQNVSLQGTSFAAPYVAGVAALVRSKYPDLTAREVMRRLEATAQHPSGPGGRNNQVGYGIVNPVAALTALVPGQNGVPPQTDTQVPAALPMSALKNWTPLHVAMIGTGGAVVLLLATLFVVRTLRRNKTG